MLEKGLFIFGEMKTNMKPEDAFTSTAPEKCKDNAWLHEDFLQLSSCVYNFCLCLTGSINQQ